MTNVEFTLTEEDAYRLYDEMLDECHPEVFSISPSRILKECDPIAYRVGFSDYVSGLEEDGQTVEGWS